MKDTSWQKDWKPFPTGLFVTSRVCDRKTTIHNHRTGKSRINDPCRSMSRAGQSFFLNKLSVFLLGTLSTLYNPFLPRTQKPVGWGGTLHPQTCAWNSRTGVLCLVFILWIWHFTMPLKKSLYLECVWLRRLFCTKCSTRFVQNVQLRCPLWKYAGCQLQLNLNTKGMRLLSYCA